MRSKFKKPIRIIVEKNNQSLSFAEFIDMTLSYAAELEEKEQDRVNKGPSEIGGDFKGKE